MGTFCQYTYFEFKIIDKVFSEGFLELQPSGVGFTGTGPQAGGNVYSLGMVNPHAVNRSGAQYAKYLASQMPWSLTIYAPSSSGPAGAAATLLATTAGGQGLWLVSFLKGLTDRAIQ
jgi:delta 1-pyrroline-5-carboxylate dehydrogenase